MKFETSRNKIHHFIPVISIKPETEKTLKINKLAILHSHMILVSKALFKQMVLFMNVNILGLNYLKSFMSMVQRHVKNEADLFPLVLEGSHESRGISIGYKAYSNAMLNMERYSDKIILSCKALKITSIFSRCCDTAPIIKLRRLSQLLNFTLGILVTGCLMGRKR